jgi:hypothetical protein
MEFSMAMDNSMKRMSALLIVLALFSGPIEAQQTTDTNCYANGNIVNCTSTTTNNSAKQQQNQQSEYQIGSALGGGLASWMLHHRIKKFCKNNPGSDYEYHNGYGVVIASGTCPSD